MSPAVSVNFLLPSASNLCRLKEEVLWLKQSTYIDVKLELYCLWSLFHFSHHLQHIVLQLKLNIKNKSFLFFLNQATGTASPHSTVFPRPLERWSYRGYWFVQREKTEKRKSRDERQISERQKLLSCYLEREKHSQEWQHISPFPAESSGFLCFCIFIFPIVFVCVCLCIRHRMAVPCTIVKTTVLT